MSERKKCRSCGGDVYHYAGCAIGDHGQIIEPPHTCEATRLLDEIAEYARCLDGCARVLALRHARVDHGPDYCTCEFQKLAAKLESWRSSVAGTDK